jgi:hypothetical protein
MADMAPEADPLLQVWSTPMGVRRWAQADAVNPLLVRVFQSMRATDPEANAGAAFYASRDDLLQRVRLSEWEQLITFIVDGLRQTVVLANQTAWPEARPGLQVDDDAKRAAHPVLGAANGVTRFYGPHFNHLGGAHMDFGNAYLQSAHLDIAPLPGQLVVFPSWLPHQAMPYQGEADRIIVSFNASVHAASGSDQLHPYAHV